jgi:hypothetical protein
VYSLRLLNIKNAKKNLTAGHSHRDKKYIENCSKTLVPVCAFSFSAQLYINVSWNCNADLTYCNRKNVSSGKRIARPENRINTLDTWKGRQKFRHP